MHKIIIALCVCMVLIACSDESVELRNAVTAYNKMLIEALAKPDENIMKYFTTADELSRIGAYILRLEAEKKIMVSELSELAFTDISQPEKGKTALVRTRERWTYYFVDVKTREPITGQESIGYENTYHLQKQDNHWVVNRVVIKEM